MKISMQTIYVLCREVEHKTFDRSIDDYVYSYSTNLVQAFKSEVEAKNALEAIASKKASKSFQYYVETVELT